MSWLVGLWLASNGAFAETIDRVVAVIGDQPLLASDVRLTISLTAADPSGFPWWRARLGNEGSGEAALELAIDAAIARAAAADVSLYQPPKEAVEAKIAELAGGMGETEWAAFVTSTGLDDAHFIQAIRRRMVVERFLLRNLQASPHERERWLAEAEALLAQMRPRIRVRRIPLQSPP